MSDLVERLRSGAANYIGIGATPNPVWIEAADEIEWLHTLAYAYPPHHCFAPDGVTWKQESERLQRELAEARGLLRETKRDLRIAAKCMNPLTPVFRQFNDTASRIDAFLAEKPL